VRSAVAAGYAARLRGFLLDRRAALSRRLGRMSLPLFRTNEV
jgi:hypothetical protein